MAMEVADSSFAMTENVSEPNGSANNNKVNITFGSHCVDEPIKAEADNVLQPNVPKDAVDEWPEPSQILSFYIVRYRALEDQNLRAKLDAADKELQKKNQARLQILEKIKAKRANRAQVIVQIRSLSAENKQFRTIMDEKRKEMEPLQQALGKLRGSGGGERGPSICSSEQELNDLIKSLQYRIQHESIPLTEEKQILRDIKQLEGTRQKVIANAAERARIQDSMGEKEAIQGQVKLIGVGLDGVRKEKQVINAKLKQLDDEKLAIEKDINILEGELTAVMEKRDATFETIKDMRKQREEGNSPFYQNRALLMKAKALAANKEVDALKELTETEVDTFLSLWNANKAFRADYEKRIQSSLDMRQLSRDGRLRGPNEKPLVRNEATPPAVKSSSDPIPKPSAKPILKEEAVGPTDQEISPSEPKAQKAKGGAKSKKKEIGSEIGLDEGGEEDDGYFVGDGPKGVVGLGRKEEEVDERKLMERRREEEIAKRHQAEERKRKLAEKAAAKAAAKAQKEAEKKTKEREKRARKKAGGGAAIAPPDSDEAPPAEEAAKPEQKMEEKIEPPRKNKGMKENTARARGSRPRASDSLPRAILKHKKATNYWAWAWAWAAPAAAVALTLLLVIGYNYLG